MRAEERRGAQTKECRGAQRSAEERRGAHTSTDQRGVQRSAEERRGAQTKEERTGAQKSAEELGEERRGAQDKEEQQQIEERAEQEAPAAATTGANALEQAERESQGHQKRARKWWRRQRHAVRQGRGRRRLAEAQGVCCRRG